jgi:NAD(P)-dependent dehydrogenase (short-subunit alcohol dehydrogenase family)
MGIGLATAQELAGRGHEIVLVARGGEELERACATLPGDGHTWNALDVSDDGAWRSLVLQDLHGLVCAAAVIDPVGAVGQYAPAEFRRTLEINVCGTLFAIHHCLPALRAGGGAIVTFSGGGGTAPLPRYDAYAASKAAVVRLTENLATEIAPITINAVAPGFVATRMHDSTLSAGPERAGGEYYERTLRDLDRGGVPPAEAAELVAMLLSGVPFTGKLISAQWDPWRDPEFRERLAGDPNLGTVRRIDSMLFTEAARQPSAQ